MNLHDKISAADPLLVPVLKQVATDIALSLFLFLTELFNWLLGTSRWCSKRRSSRHWSINRVLTPLRLVRTAQFRTCRSYRSFWSDSFDLSWLRDVIGHATYSIPHRPFLIDGLLELIASISSRFQELGCRPNCKHIGITTLTFQGHVISSVTWPFDSP